METTSVDQLIKEATAIISKGKSDKWSIKTLTQIRRYLSLAYRDKNMEWSAKEWLYNGERSSLTVEYQETMAVGKAENQAKAVAEINNGNYREINADAQGISKMLDAIAWYVINSQVENKAGNDAQF